jgi:hypothetical protein
MIRWLVLALLLATPAHAGPVGAVFGALAGFVGSLGVVGTALLQIGTGIVLSALSRALAPKPEKPKFPGLAIDYTAGETVPLTMVIGRTAVRGHKLGPAYSAKLEAGLPNAFLFRPTVLADYPINDVLGAYVDGTWTTFGTVLDDDPVGYPALMDPFVGRFFMRAYTGAQTTTDANMLANFGGAIERPWLSDMIGRNKATVYPVFRIEQEGSPFSGEPLPVWEVEGAPLFDPRTGTTVYTENPLVVAWNVLRGITIAGVGVWGMNVDAADLPSTVWFGEMNVCDEVPPTIGGKRYRCGMEFGFNQEALDILAELLKACGGDIADCGGVWQVRAGPPPTSVWSFTDEDVIVTEGREFQMFPGLADTFNAVSATYPDPRNAWEATAAVPFTNAAWEAEDGGKRLTAELTFPAVPYPEQVRRLMRETAEDNRRFRSHILTLPPAALHVMPLDTVAWTSAENGYDAKLFEVVEKTFDPVVLNSLVMLRERDPSDYDWDDVSDSDLPSPPSRVGQDRTIHGVDGFDAVGTSIQDSTGTDRRPAVHCVWDLRDLDGIEIEVVTNITEQLVVTKQVGRAVVNVGGTVFGDGLLPGQTYKARARAIAAGRPTTWTAYDAFTTPGVFLNEVDMAAEFIAKVDGALEQANEAAADVNGALLRITDIEGETFVTTTVDSNGRTGLAIVKGDGTPLGAIQLNSPFVIAPGMLGASKLVVADFSGNNCPDADMRDVDAWLLPAGWTFHSPSGVSSLASTGEVRHTGTASSTRGSGFSVAPGDTFEASVALRRAAASGSTTGRVGIQFYDSSGAFLANAISSQVTTSALAKVTTGNRTVPSGATTAAILFFHDSGATAGFSAPNIRKKQAGASLVTPGGIATPDLAAGSVTAAILNAVSLNAAGLAIFGGTLQSANWPTGGFQLLQNGNASFAGTVSGTEFLPTAGLKLNSATVVAATFEEEFSSANRTYSWSLTGGRVGGQIIIWTFVTVSGGGLDFEWEEFRLTVNGTTIVVDAGEADDGPYMVGQTLAAINGTNTVSVRVDPQIGTARVRAINVFMTKA